MGGGGAGGGGVQELAKLAGKRLLHSLILQSKWLCYVVIIQKGTIWKPREASESKESPSLFRFIFFTCVSNANAQLWPARLHFGRP